MFFGFIFLVLYFHFYALYKCLLNKYLFYIRISYFINRAHYFACTAAEFARAL